MIFNFKKDFVIDSTAARETIPQLVKQYGSMLEDNRWALTEIKAIWDSKTIEELQRVVWSTLEESDVVRIVSGMLDIDPEPYALYLESQSSKRNLKLSNKTFEKNEDRYQNIMQDFLNDNTLQTSLWSYHFELDSLHHESPLASTYEVNVHHDNKMRAEIEVKSTGHKEKVDEDVVWLDDFSQDIEPNYFKLDSHKLTQDLANEYQKFVSDDYVPFHHRPMITDVSWVLWG